LDGFGDVAVPK
jgi:hypothetical protein